MSCESSNGASELAAAPATKLDAAPSFAERVADLQAEFFAEDVSPPPRAERWTDERLRTFFERGGAELADEDFRALDLSCSGHLSVFDLRAGRLWARSDAQVDELLCLLPLTSHF